MKLIDRKIREMKEKKREDFEHIGEHIRVIVTRVQRLSVCHRDPHRFHEEKSEIAYELSKIARSIA
ncbi:hypothetical protein Z949_2462 [Sulfitobacter guttiformis KCTC 32187]|uniref:Uncharacterized protein n=2 Tax=Sulfitobacter guttiformis TaxID=74349 RepID=A0A420DNZ0_9RHOB|nr:hypothetical protein Z949_2462 [Sulfitobacter guttiformis KCTC 32187]RKE95945.1 hypothetical protein C8N30_0492 [Sulfitobacter guttiformis]